MADNTTINGENIPFSNSTAGQEDFFRSLAENSSDMIYRMTLPDGVYEYVNPVVERLFGCTPEEFYANPRVIFKKIHPDWIPYLEENWQKLLEGVVPPTYEYQIIDKNGDTRWMMQYNSLSFGPGGKPAAVQGIVRDITNQKNKEVLEKEQYLWAESLSSTAADLNSTLQLEEVLDRILANIGKVVPHDAIDIMKIEGHVARIVRQVGFEKFGSLKTALDLRYPIPNLPIFQWILNHQEATLIPDTSLEKDWVVYPDTQWIRCFICIPIILDNTVWGFLNLSNRDANIYTPKQLERLKAFANHAATAIDNARLFEEAQKELEERKRTEKELREREAHLWAILEAIPDILFRVDDNGKILDCTSREQEGYAFFRLFIGESLQELLPPEQARQILNGIHAALESGHIEIFDFRLPGTKGSHEDFEIRLAPSGEAEAVAIVRNITKRNQTEEALRKSEERYHRLFEDSALGIFQSTLEGKDIEVNPAHARMFGYASPEELLASIDDVNNLFAEPARRSETMRMILQSETAISVENVYRRKDGSVFNGILHAWKVKNREGHFVYIEGFVEDITRRKKAEETLAWRLKEQAALYAVVAAGNESLTEDSLIANVTRLLGEGFFPYDFGVLLLDEKSGVLERHHSFNSILPKSAWIDRIPLGKGITGKVAASGLPLRLGNVNDFPGFIRTNTETRSELCVPIKTGGKVLGVIDTENNHPDAFSEDDERFLLAVADHLATAIARIRLLENLEEKVAERTRYLAALYDISAAASELSTIDLILQSLLEKSLEVMSCPMGMIHLIQENSNELLLAAEQGIPLDEDPDLPFDEIQVWEKVLEQKDPVIISLLTNNPQLKMELGMLPKTYLGVHIRAKGQTLGVLSLFNSEQTEPSPEDLDLLSTIGEQIGIAVERERLHEKSEAIAVVEERQRLARDLHDSVSQSLYSLTLMVKGAHKMASGLAKGDLASYLQEIGSTAQQALKEMRLLIYELRPSLLVQDGLKIAIQKRLEAVEQHADIQVNFDFQSSSKIPPIIEDGLYRITQEALNNILKHSGASIVSVSLIEINHHISLEIQDNGRGFDPESGEQPQGVGFQIMRERVERLGGKLEVTSKPGKGTLVKVSLELEENQPPLRNKRPQRGIQND